MGKSKMSSSRSRPSKKTKSTHLKKIQYKKGKKEVYLFLSQLYDFFKTHPQSILLKKLKGCVGYYDYDDEVMAIDYRKDFIPTLIHEFTHHLHPQWKEKDVIRKERHIMGYLSGIQCRNIFRAMLCAIH